MTRLSALICLLLLLGPPAIAGPLHDAVKSDDVAEVKRLIAVGDDVNEMAQRLGSPLHQAAASASAEMAELLLASGADVNAESPLLGTPLAVAAAKGNVGVAAVLLARGADQRPKASDGRTPLHLAAVNGSAAMIELLIEAGANINARTTDDRNYAAIHSAGTAGHFDIVALLTALGATGPTVEPVIDRLASADPLEGEAVYEERCHICHKAVEKGLPARPSGPNLWSLIGKDKASSEGFKYSTALQRLGGRWTFAELNAYLASPTDYAPGTYMFVKVEDATQRAALIAYLRQRADDPVPLPLRP